jgi:hypothetical protein
MSLVDDMDSGGRNWTRRAVRRWRPSNANARWPQPTVPEPELEKLMSWLFSDECEATDGCVTVSCPIGTPAGF